MKTMGFVNSRKENEKRFALLPQDLADSLDLASNLCFETGYGARLGIPDAQYQETGAHIVSRDNILQSCDIICDVKAGDAEYLNRLADGRTIFGWVHPHVSGELRQTLLKKRFSVYAWEEMMEQGILKQHGERIEMQYQSAAACGVVVPATALRSIPPMEVPVCYGGVVLFVIDVQQYERY